MITAFAAALIYYGLYLMTKEIKSELRAIRKVLEDRNDAT